MLPGNRHSVWGQASADRVMSRGSVISSTDVVLSGPDHFDRRLDRLRELHCLPHEMAVERRAPAEASAQEGSVDLDLLRAQSGDLRRGSAVGGLELRAGPDV